jgi:hypothetical protein
VLDLLSRGLSNQKLDGRHRRVQAVIYAYETGLVRAGGNRAETAGCDAARRFRRATRQSPRLLPLQNAM